MRHPMNDLPVGKAGTETLKGRALGAASGGVHRTRGVATVRITNDVADTEEVTVTLADGRVFVFEFDTDATVTVGNIAVDVSGGVTPVLATAALRSVMQANLPAQVTNPSANEVHVIAAGLAMVGATFAETMGGADNVVDGAMKGEVSHGSPNLQASSRVPTADEVALGLLFFPQAFLNVDGWVIRVEDGAGATVAWNGVAVKEVAGVQLDNSGGVDWSAADTVHILVWGRNDAAEDRLYFD